MNKSPREAAFLAVYDALKENQYASKTLEAWYLSASPSKLDFNLAQEIAYGAIRMALALDYIAAQAAQKGKLSLKVKERALLRTAVYQLYFMDRIPGYAVVNETVEIAKKHFRSVFPSFLNALLRQLSQTTTALPQGNTAQDLSIRYSYPQFFVEELIKDYGVEQAITIMEAENIPAIVMARQREPAKGPDYNLQVKIVEDIHEDKIATSRYIQNSTPVFLVDKLFRGGAAPRNILDLCAAPGGKLLLAHDLFPQTSLYANDVSTDKVRLLQENIDKYGLKVDITCGPGEQYPKKGPFDLIIVDAPCSNTGVLNKRPEARWRLSKENIAALEKMQFTLLQKAISLLSERGEIWYMTCSILKSENEGMVARVSKELKARIRVQQSILPNLEGADGGFGCALLGP